MLTSLALLFHVMFLAAVTTSWESPYALIARDEMRNAYRALRSFRSSGLAAAQDLFRIHHRFEMGGRRQANPSRRTLVSNFKICRALLPSLVLLLPLILVGFDYEALLGTGETTPDTPQMSAEFIFLTLFFTILFTVLGVFFLLRATRRLGLRSVLIGTILLDLLVRYVLYLSKLSGLSLPPGAIPHIVWKTALLTLIPDISALVLIFLFTIDTMHLNLEEAEDRLAISLKKVVVYRIRVELPYLFQRYCLRRNVELLSFDEFYHSFDEITL
ncbi:hypothetical protein P170DRAFT_478076 [Aspergillus steynii IBT 23096]|uniref:Uncharacterized protein n=1 Tax=Aspergillus steynii IBT 23096 TaxID=1392250 RepID=A0A2I2G2W7_9EURO|nr:uncharacterized protein P170DRAFT_478076 [Aspergillus steynii IBT 23096]PLB47215.1 hypothetical protein P170DRAFT_478076 [Aspergillus steynii IBT 23096]